MMWLILFLDLIIIVYCIMFMRMMLRMPSRAPFVPTRPEVLKEIMGVIGTLPAGSVLYDLGCGDARMLVGIAKRNPDAQFTGIELQFVPYLIAKFRTRGMNIAIKRGLFEKYDISDATHVYAYLYPNVMDQLLPKFEKELHPGAVVYSLDFPISKRKEDRSISLTSRQSNKLGKELFIYTF
jgi:trans-aconitate methyltransferase